MHIRWDITIITIAWRDYMDYIYFKLNSRSNIFLMYSVSCHIGTSSYQNFFLEISPFISYTFMFLSIGSEGQYLVTVLIINNKFSWDRWSDFASYSWSLSHIFEIPIRSTTSYYLHLWCILTDYLMVMEDIMSSTYIELSVWFDVGWILILTKWYFSLTNSFHPLTTRVCPFPVYFFH